MRYKYPRLLLTLLFLGFTSVPVAQGAAPPPLPATQIKLPQLPPLQALEEASLRRAGLQPQLIQRWQKKSRLAPALPRIQFGYEQKAQIQNTTVVQDSISVTSTGVSIGPEANRLDQDLGNNRGFDVKAVWALDELIFNHEELDVSREARDLLVIRNLLTQELHQTYYDLKTQLTRFQLEEGLAEDPLERLKAEQLMDKLNSLTGGEFKRLLSEMTEKKS